MLKMILKKTLYVFLKKNKTKWALISKDNEIMWYWPLLIQTASESSFVCERETERSETEEMKRTDGCFERGW